MELCLSHYRLVLLFLFLSPTSNTFPLLRQVTRKCWFIAFVIITMVLGKGRLISRTCFPFLAVSSHALFFLCFTFRHKEKKSLFRFEVCQTASNPCLELLVFVERCLRLSQGRLLVLLISDNGMIIRSSGFSLVECVSASWVLWFFLFSRPILFRKQELNVQLFIRV